MAFVTPCTVDHGYEYLLFFYWNFRHGVGEEDIGFYDENHRVIASRATYKTSASITSIGEKKTLQSIREMCVNYLIRWLYANIGEGRGKNSHRMEESIDGYANDYLGNHQVQNIQNTGGTYNFGQFQMNMSYYHDEVEQTQFSTVGTVKTADGREINFNLGLSMSRRFQEYVQTTSAGEFVQLTDPLVINLDTNMTTLSDPDIRAWKHR